MDDDTTASPSPAGQHAEFEEEYDSYFYETSTTPSSEEKSVTWKHLPIIFTVVCILLILILFATRRRKSARVTMPPRPKQGAIRVSAMQYNDSEDKWMVDMLPNCSIHNCNKKDMKNKWCAYTCRNTDAI